MKISSIIYSSQTAEKNVISDGVKMKKAIIYFFMSAYSRRHMYTPFRKRTEINSTETKHPKLSDSLDFPVKTV